MPPRTTTRKTYQLAHDLRHETTEIEARLWTYLRAHRMRNIHFRRQYAIGKYVVDFCALKIKLIIELDGSQHLDTQEEDNTRSSYLGSKGYRILRFWNNDVTFNLDRVLGTIEQTIDELSSSI